MRNVLVYEAETQTLHRETIKDDYKELWRLVGGYIDCPVLSETLYNEGIDCFINEEGKLIGLAPSCAIVSQDEVVDVVVGNIVFAGHDDEGNTISLTEKQEEIVSNMLTDGGELVPVARL